MVRTSTQDRHQQLIEGTVAFIAEHLDESLELAGLAARAGLSPHYFQRVFRSRLGESPKQFVRRLRLERSAFLLKDPGARVTDVAFATSYERHESFTRAFHAHFGVSPRRYQSKQASGRREQTDPFEIVLLGSRRLAVVPFVGHYDEANAAFEQLARWAGPLGLLDGQNMLGVYFDDQMVTPEEKTRCEAALSIKPDVPVGPGIRIRVLEEGHYAVVHHRGPESVRATYERVFRNWFPSDGWRPDLRAMLVEYHDRGDGEATLFVSIKR